MSAAILKKLQEEVDAELASEKKTSTSSNSSGSICNVYEKIPKNMLDDAPNPHYNIHKFKIPSRFIVVAPSGSGKTNFLINLLATFSAKPGTFHSICIVTRNKDEPLYNFLASKHDDIKIVEGLQNTPLLDKYDKHLNHVLVFDDLVLSKSLDKVAEYYIRARKKNVTCLFLSQTFYGIPKIIRLNANYMIILKLSNTRDSNAILREMSLGLTKEQLIAIYEYATKEKFSPLIIDLDCSEPKEKFRKGFQEFIDPANYSGSSESSG